MLVEVAPGVLEPVGRGSGDIDRGGGRGGDTRGAPVMAQKSARASFWGDINAGPRGEGALTMVAMGSDKRATPN